jgi:ribosomal protein L1
MKMTKNGKKVNADLDRMKEYSIEDAVKLVKKLKSYEGGKLTTDLYYVKANGNQRLTAKTTTSRNINEQ